MSYQDHLKTCSYCSNKNPQKMTIRVKSAASYYNDKKLSELAAIIKGISYPGISYAGEKANANTKTKPKTKGASNPQRQFKLKELGKMIRGL